MKNRTSPVRHTILGLGGFRVCGRGKRTRVTDFGISPDDLRRLARLIDDNGLSELRYEEGDLRVTLRTSAYRPAPAAAPSAPSTFDAVFEDEPAVAATPLASAPLGASAIEAPVMGVFYRSPALDEPPFVEIGDRVEIGDPVGLIEAMKVFSEVLAEASGVVVAVPALNGALVQPGDPLILLQEGEA